MSGLITDLTAIPSIDRTVDVLEIVDVSANASYKVTPNNLVGISGGSVVSTSDSQTLTNKVIGNTNTLTVKDTLFTLQDDGDTTKQVTFQLSGLTTATTRVLTIPDASLTLVGTATTQTLTNKTLTSPVINTPTIVNPNLQTDSIAEYTADAGVTVDGLLIKNGAIGTNGVVTASVTDGAVTPAKLQSGTGTGWAYQSWTPTWTNFTPGNATVSYKYNQTGKTVFFRGEITLGSTSSMGSNPTFTLPVTSIAYTNPLFPIGVMTITAATGAATNGYLTWGSTTTGVIRYWDANNNNGAITASTPITWALNSYFGFEGFYEAA